MDLAFATRPLLALDFALAVPRAELLGPDTLPPPVLLFAATIPPTEPGCSAPEPDCACSKPAAAAVTAGAEDFFIEVLLAAEPPFFFPTSSCSCSGLSTTASFEEEEEAGCAGGAVAAVTMGLGFVIAFAAPGTGPASDPTAGFVFFAAAAGSTSTLVPPAAVLSPTTSGSVDDTAC